MNTSITLKFNNYYIYQISRHCDIGTINKLLRLNKKINKLLRPFLDAELNFKFTRSSNICIDEHLFNRYIKWSIRYINKCFKYACSNNFIEGAKYLYSMGADIGMKYNYCIKHAILCNHLELAKWLYSVGTDIYENSYNNTIYQDEYLEIAKWLHSVGEDKFIFANFCIKTASKYNQLELVKYLHSIGMNIPDKCIKNACVYEHMEMAKWAYSKGADIHVDDDYCIKAACSEGHLEMAKWLYSKGANIHKYINACLISACKVGSVETAIWLYSLGADTQYIKENSKRYPRNIEKWIYTLK